MLGDETTPGELNCLSSIGERSGFPYCHGSEISDSKLGDRGDCREFGPPAQELGPHVAPLGIEFYTGDMFPAAYRGRIFIAEHGSWDRTQNIGYRIMTVTVDDAGASDYRVFAEGWLEYEEVSGRPVDPLLLQDGSTLVSDDHSGSIYRISYKEP